MSAVLPVPARPLAPARAAYAAGWPPETFIVPLLARRIDELLVQCARTAMREARVLDAGCGRQPFRARLEALGCDYRSLDAVQNPEGTVEFIAALDGPLPAGLVGPAGFDLILCTEVLEHVADWPAAFRNLARLLAPGGTVLVTCPHFYPLHEVPYDFWRPTGHAIRHHAQAVGLTVRLLEQAGGMWDVLGTLLADATVYPRSRRLADRALAWALRRLCYLTFSVLARGRLQRRCELKGHHYLANIALLQRSAD